MAKAPTRILKVSLDLDASLLEEIDSAFCFCGGQRDEDDPSVCVGCLKLKRVSRTRAGVRSATDGSGMIDCIVREYLAPKHPPKLEDHLVLNRARIGLYMEEPLHVKARNVAYSQRRSLSALLANVIAARFQGERAA